MGIHGLTSYLKQHQRALSQSLQLPSAEDVTFVIDGWSFIYELHRRSKLPWVYGGEYLELSQHVGLVVRAWIDLGIRIEFVFDGPNPALKFQTMIKRLEQTGIRNCSLFFRTSTTGRTNLIREVSTIPPLVLPACVHALQEISSASERLNLHFADEEGDPGSVELAGRLRAYVVGNDSDFVILNTIGYRGYIPFDSMLWLNTAVETTLEPALPEDDGFQTVSKGKKQKRAVDPRFGRGLLPPDVLIDAQLSCEVYTPSSLAAHLKIPKALLPLFGALVGNDYTNISQTMFFHAKSSPIQHIDRVAACLATLVAKPSQAMESEVATNLIMSAVNALLVPLKTTISPAKFDAMIDNLVEATLQYTIPDSVDVGDEILKGNDDCPLHSSEDCPLTPMVSRNLDRCAPEEAQSLRQVITSLLRAYRDGCLNSKALDVLGTATYWPRLFLENPDVETTAGSLGRSIRIWSYSILHDAFGIPDQIDLSAPIDTSIRPSDVGDKYESDDDELVDVIEVQSDEEWESNLSISDAALALVQSYTESTASQRNISRTVNEFIRRGLRIAPHLVSVTPLKSLLESVHVTHPPAYLLLEPEDIRFELFLRATRSNDRVLLELPPEQVIIAVTIRHVVATLHKRAAASPENKERARERWTPHETKSMLAAFTHSSSSTTDASEILPVLNRNVQLIAQFSASLEAVALLSQVLLLSKRAPNPIHRFSGRRFHVFASKLQTIGHADVSDSLWQACVVGLEGSLAHAKPKKAEKGERITKSAQGLAPKSGKPRLFSVLADMPSQ